MRRTWLDDVADVTRNGTVVRAVVVEAKGSCPRDAGASMLVCGGHTDGTIGGGALEFEVIAKARAMLEQMPAQPWLRSVLCFHLGPELNQCCGGAVTVLLERFGEAEGDAVRRLALEVSGGGVQRPVDSGVPLAAANAELKTGLERRCAGDEWFVERVSAAVTPLFLYGGGHVARALVLVLDGLPFEVTWVDEAVERFPEAQVRSVVPVVAGDLAQMASTGVAGAYHLVMTHSHALDEAIVDAVLRRGTFGYLGLIGSATKRARFRQRLLKGGLAPALVDRMECPIGLVGLAGKEPHIIAVSVAADLLLRRQRVSDCG